MWQKVQIIGNVGRNAELKYTKEGIAICDFSVAVNKTFGKGEDRQQRTTWFKVTVWRDRAEVAAKYIKKGMLIFVEGEITASAYMSKQGTALASLEITAHNFQFLSSNRDGESHNSEAAGETAGEPVGETAGPTPGDEIPF